MQAFNPFISVVIPVYNGADYLAEAIESVLAQRYTHYEIVVVNDGSTDNGATEAVAKGYGDRIRYFSKPNGGVATALNLAIEKAQGEYISWLSHDDLYTPHKLESQVQLLAAMEQAERAHAVLYGNCSLFTDDPAQDQLVKVPAAAPQDFRYSLTIRGELHGCTLLIPKVAFEQLGYFDSALRTTQDYDLWFRMAAQFRFHHADAHLVKSRQHAQQGSVTMSSIARQECNALYIRCVQQLSTEEILRGSGASNLAVAYATMMYSFFRRGFIATGWALLPTVLKQLKWHQPEAVAQVVVLFVKSMLAYGVMQPLRRVLPPELRRLIRCLLKRG